LKDICSSINKNIKLRETTRKNNKLNLNEDIMLQKQLILPDIQAEINNPKNVFLTGATGLLGSYLLKELLKSDKKLRVYCLVRSKDKKHGIKRIINNLNKHGLWRKEFPKRILPIPGNLEKPLLGIKPALFHKLTKDIDAICHNGAMVNFVYPYEVLKPANVSSTREIIKLATKNKLKAIHYISSMSVFESETRNKVYYEHNIPNSMAGLWGGYPQTKLVSEKLLDNARKKGVPVNIYRPGRLIGSANMVDVDTEDALARFIKGVVRLGYAPMLQTYLDITPVDYAAGIIVSILKNKACKYKGLNYHIVNPQMISLKRLIRNINKSGYNITFLPFAEWLKKLDKDEKNPLRAFHALISNRGVDVMGYKTRIDIRNSLPFGKTYALPDIDILLKKYLKVLLKPYLARRF
jgi:thioester reductase-like protein